MVNSGSNNSMKKRGCALNKPDFLPEESFQSWGNYAKVLSSTKTRLKDRPLARSDDNLELHAMLASSEHEMKKTLNWFDLIWFGIGAVMGAGKWNLCSHRRSCPERCGPSRAGNILFEYLVAGASVARSWTSYFATLCNHDPNDFRINMSSFPAEYGHLDPIAVAVSIAICVGASISMKGSSRFNSVATIIHLVISLFILVTGLTKANPANYENFAPNGIRGILKALAVLFFAYVGFDGVATLGEEIKNPGRDIPIGIVGSMLITITVYCILSGTLCLMQPYSEIDVDAPFTKAFQAAGMNWVHWVH
ncbi:hypothetical protein Dsin_028228 [Dipteronia sinensis]|uniref:Uncharacterized protein n=1 Tax=Dipteronia sinensis TaxID=43782 RepID=A0AAE0DVC6_9ROSI|nr:hypothetical protein Dsin_028228 [Dipteronia sinensis]